MTPAITPSTPLAPQLGASEAAALDQEHLRVPELQLPLYSDLRQKRVARVAHSLLSAEPLGGDHGQAFFLPAHDATAKDGDVFVAEPLEGVCGTGGAVVGAA